MGNNPQNQQALWWKQGVIYQVYPRSFKDENGDGIGDLSGIIAKLNHLTWLGVDAIWISPIYPSPMVDFGYDVTDFTGIDPIFGDLATFDALVAQAHQNGIKVIMDYVPNHTSDQHPWFLESRSSRQNPKRDWYVWVDPKPDGSPPNNWLGSWGGSAWEWDANTHQYYLHSYHKAMPDLNWRNPAVKEAMFDVARFWLDRGVDGLRIDSAQRIMKDPHLRDNPPNPTPEMTAYKRLGDYDSQLHLYDKGHADIHAVYRELRQLLDTYSAQSPRVALGEMHIFDWQEWARYYGAQLDELHRGDLIAPEDAARGVRVALPVAHGTEDEHGATGVGGDHLEVVVRLGREDRGDQLPGGGVPDLEVAAGHRRAVLRAVRDVAVDVAPDRVRVVGGDGGELRAGRAGPGARSGGR